MKNSFLKSVKKTSLSDFGAFVYGDFQFEVTKFKQHSIQFKSAVKHGLINRYSNSKPVCDFLSCATQRVRKECKVTSVMLKPDR